MAEALPGAGSEGVTPWEVALDKKWRRRQRFLDLVVDNERAIHGEYYEDREFFLPPGQVWALFKETYLDVHLPDPGDLVIDIHVVGLAGPGYYRPVVTQAPDRSILRRTLVAGDENTDWSRQLGVAFQYDLRQKGRVITSETECGILLCHAGFRAYSRARILINNVAHIIKPAELYRCGVTVVDEFISNIIGIAGEPVDLSFVRDPVPPAKANDDTMPIHDDTPPAADNN